MNRQMERTLLLNASYEPLAIVSWQRAVVLVVTGRVEVVEEYDVDIRSPSIHLKCPSVIRLKKMVKDFKQKVKFSRINVFGRDNFTCQYCGHQPGIEGLTFDHVVPRSSGGKTDWSNIVTACFPCNSKKGSKALADTGMWLKKHPSAPDYLTRIRLALLVRSAPEQWKPYLRME